MKKNKYCKTCGYLHPQAPMCQLRGEQVDVNTDFCSKHQEISVVGNCAICGNPIYNTNLLLDMQEDGTFRHIHLACGRMLNTCNTCKHHLQCEFETNPDPTPKLITQTVRQGNMIMQTQIRNPDRVHKFCYECPCFDSENECLKQFNCCGNYTEKTAQ